jgi:hypothetical protein
MKLTTLFVLTGYFLMLSMSAGTPSSKPVIERTEYWALPGKADEVYRWRIHACDIRENIGLPRGHVLRRQGNSDTLADVVWQIEYPDEAGRLRDLKMREESAEFQSVRDHMHTLTRRFERGFWQESQ